MHNSLPSRLITARDSERIPWACFVWKHLKMRECAYLLIMTGNAFPLKRKPEEHLIICPHSEIAPPPDPVPASTHLCTLLLTPITLECMLSEERLSATIGVCAARSPPCPRE